MWTINSSVYQTGSCINHSQHTSKSEKESVNVMQWSSQGLSRVYLSHYRGRQAQRDSYSFCPVARSSGITETVLPLIHLTGCVLVAFCSNSPQVSISVRLHCTWLLDFHWLTVHETVHGPLGDHRGGDGAPCYHPHPLLQTPASGMQNNSRGLVHKVRSPSSLQPRWRKLLLHAAFCNWESKQRRRPVIQYNLLFLIDVLPITRISP